MKKIYLVTEIGEGIHFAFNTQAEAQEWIDHQTEGSYEILPVNYVTAPFTYNV